MTEDLRNQIHAANVAVHRYEAQFYEVLHPEVYNKEEQDRISSTLKAIDHLVTANRRQTLDFGAGTGNLTGKLLNMGYTVTAVDISAEMCSLLKRKYADWLRTGKLFVVNASIEDVNFAAEEFDLVACYSVLHHLPDYKEALRRLSGFLRKGGVMYIDHEASPFYWTSEASNVANLVKSLYFHSNPVLNALYFQLVGVVVPTLDYTLSDYWHKKEHPLDHSVIKRVFKEKDFEYCKRTDYYSKKTWIPNPLFYAYRRFCNPDVSCWIAKK